MTKPKETQPAPGKALLRQLSSSIAVSPKDIQRGQFALLDRQGRAVGRQWFKRRVAAYRIVNFAAILGSAALFVGGFPIVGGALYFAVIGRALRIRWRGGSKLLAVDMLVRAGNLDEAQRDLDKLGDLRRRNPSYYCRLAGRIASSRGDHAKALEWWQAATPHVKGLELALVKLSMTGSLILSGRLKEAHAMRDGAVFPEAADELLTGQSLVRVMFTLCDPSTKPMTDEELHEAARRALEYSHTGTEVAAIGWAFARAGDHEMAQWLASEAQERMHSRYLATSWPELHAWLESKATTTSSD
ncbi:MAG TPA: hypothetical protein VGM39_21070 [Kofleriaceae bacterium]